MKKTLAFAAALSLAASSGCALEPDATDTDITDIDSSEQDFWWGGWGKSGLVAVGASVTDGVGASDWIPNPENDPSIPETGSVAMFAEYLGLSTNSEDGEYLNLAVPGATSAQILDGQIRDAWKFNRRGFRQDRVIWLASGGNDLLALIDPVVLAPCFAPPDIPGLPISSGCYKLFYDAAAEYEDNLRKTINRLAISAWKHKAVLLARTEAPSLDEANCSTDGAIDQFGNVFIPPEFVVALRPLADFAFEGQVPALPGTEFDKPFEGFNVVMRRLVAEAGERFRIKTAVIDTFLAFKIAAQQGGDLVTRDCVHPNDAGHELIRDIAIEAYESL